MKIGETRIVGMNELISKTGNSGEIILVTTIRKDDDRDMKEMVRGIVVPDETEEVCVTESDEHVCVYRRKKIA